MTVLMALVLGPGVHGLAGSHQQAGGLQLLSAPGSVSRWQKSVLERSGGLLAQQPLQPQARCGDDSLMCRLEGIAPRPRASQDLTWVPVTRSVTVEELSSQLSIDETRLARLNGVDEDHRFNKGQWLAIPSRSLDLLPQIFSIDLAKRRSSPPSTQVTHQPLASSGVVRLGDTIAEIARRYGMTIADLLRLNPGLETAKLVVGTQVRLAQAGALPALPPVLGLNPAGSGGASWPEQPRLSIPLSAGTDSRSAPVRRFDASIENLASDGILTSSERIRFHRGLVMPLSSLPVGVCESAPLSRYECNSLAATSARFSSIRAGNSIVQSPGSFFRGQPSRQALLQRIRESREGVPRTFGSCTYRWDGWRMASNGVRTTTYSCNQAGVKNYTVGVSCAKLKVNSFKPVSARSGPWAWSEWRHPEAGGEEEMVAALCSNLQSSL